MTTFQHGDQMGKHHMAPADKLLANREITDDGCWLWTRSTRTGYGMIWLEGTLYSAHRVAYETWVGPVPEGHDLDHECHNKAVARGECGATDCQHRRCFNPDHLVPRTRRGNLMASALTEAHLLHNGLKTPRWASASV